MEADMVQYQCSYTASDC